MRGGKWGWWNEGRSINETSVPWTASKAYCSSRSKRISSWTVFYFVKKHLCYFKHFCGINFVSISKKKAGLVCIYLDSVYFTLGLQCSSLIKFMYKSSYQVQGRSFELSVFVSMFSDIFSSSYFFCAWIAFERLSQLKYLQD